MKRILALSTLAAACLAGPAVAQDPNADPNYGTVELDTGYTPDPHVISLRAGGDISASSLGSGCTGFITDSPTYGCATKPVRCR